MNDKLSSQLAELFLNFIRVVAQAIGRVTAFKNFGPVLHLKFAKWIRWAEFDARRPAGRLCFLSSIAGNHTTRLAKFTLFVLRYVNDYVKKLFREVSSLFVHSCDYVCCLMCNCCLVSCMCKEACDNYTHSTSCSRRTDTFSWCCDDKSMEHLFLPRKSGF